MPIGIFAISWPVRDHARGMVSMIRSFLGHELHFCSLWPFADTDRSPLRGSAPGLWLKVERHTTIRRSTRNIALYLLILLARCSFINYWHSLVNYLKSMSNDWNGFFFFNMATNRFKSYTRLNYQTLSSTKLKLYHCFHLLTWFFLFTSLKTNVARNFSFVDDLD